MEIPADAETSWPGFAVCGVSHANRELANACAFEQSVGQSSAMIGIKSLRLKALERGIAALDWLSERRGQQPKLSAHLRTGERGEEAAFFYLRQSGFTVVAQRWNDGPLPGDIDLVAWQDDVLCFIEVKTRSSSEIATASSAVDREKRRILRRLARQYLRQLPDAERPETRFDIVTVYELPGKPREIRLIPGAFGWSED
jgi:putative endonuclease